MNLPFLKNKQWPRIGKPIGESHYGYSEDDELKEHALNELLEALESKDHSKLMDALSALIECIKNGDQNATDAHEIA